MSRSAITDYPPQRSAEWCFYTSLSFALSFTAITMDSNPQFVAVFANFRKGLLASSKLVKQGFCIKCDRCAKQEAMTKPPHQAAPIRSVFDSTARTELIADRDPLEKTSGAQSRDRRRSIQFFRIWLMETGGTPRHAPLFTLRLTALRIHLQNLDIRARSIHLKSDPPHAGTEQLVSAKLFFVKIFDLCIPQYYTNLLYKLYFKKK